MTKKKTNKDLQRAEKLMKTYTQSVVNRNALMERIKNELDAYTDNIKTCEEELIKIGNKNLGAFNTDGNLEFEDGYLHIAKNTVVIQSRKFDISAFQKAYPEMVKVTLCVAPVKKAFLDKDQRKELKAYGVSVTTEDNMQVIPYNN